MTMKAKMPWPEAEIVSSKRVRSVINRTSLRYKKKFVVPVCAILGFWKAKLAIGKENVLKMSVGFEAYRYS